MGGGVAQGACAVGAVEPDPADVRPRPLRGPGNGHGGRNQFRDVGAPVTSTLTVMEGRQGLGRGVAWTLCSPITCWGDTLKDGVVGASMESLGVMTNMEEGIHVLRRQAIPICPA